MLSSNPHSSRAPVSVEAVPVAKPQSEPVAAAPVYDEPVRPEAVLADATLPEAVLAEFELPEPEPAFVEAAPPKSKLFESIPAVVTPEPAVAVQAEANAVAEEFDEEIALDVDAFDDAGRGTGGGSRRSVRHALLLHLRGGFGDAWSDFEVPGGAAVAAASTASTPAGSTDWFSDPAATRREPRRSPARGARSSTTKRCR